MSQSQKINKLVNPYINTNDTDTKRRLVAKRPYKANFGKSQYFKLTMTRPLQSQHFLRIFPNSGLKSHKVATKPGFVFTNGVKVIMSRSRS